MAQTKDFDAGSDHVVYTDSSFRIPSIYLNDWPDRYIHTTGDVPANVDPTKLERAAFIGAASAWYLANVTAQNLPELFALLERQTLKRTATMMERRTAVAGYDARWLERAHQAYESSIVDSVGRFVTVNEADRLHREQFLRRADAAAGISTIFVGNGRSSPDELAVYVRCPQPKGPMAVFGYDWLVDHLGAEGASALALREFEGLRGGGAEYTLEVLNFVDGQRTVGTIRNVVSAEFGPVPIGHVTAYLQALAKINVIAENSSGCFTLDRARKGPQPIASRGRRGIP